MPPSSLTQTEVRGAPSARARTGGGTPASGGGPSGAGTAAGSGMGDFQVEAALLDDQAAVLDVEQPGVLGDGPRLGRGDAQLQPQRGDAGQRPVTGQDVLDDGVGTGHPATLTPSGSGPAGRGPAR